MEQEMCRVWGRRLWRASICWGQKYLTRSKRVSTLSFRTGTSLSSSDFLPSVFFFIVPLKQFEQARAHDHSRPVRWHVLFDLPAHVHDGIGVGRFQHIPILGDDGRIPIDQFLGRAVRLGAVAIENLNDLDLTVGYRRCAVENDMPDT